MKSEAVGFDSPLLTNALDEEREFLVAATARHYKTVLAVPYNKRILLLPHCMRRVGKCRACEEGFLYLCAECGACPIGALVAKARELGYQGVYVLKGGRAIMQLIKKKKPDAVFGVACIAEGVDGIKMCERFKIPVAYFPLSKDGCTDTEVDLPGCFKFLEARSDC